MATYQELKDLTGNNLLRDKVEAAVMVAADTIRLESGATPNHAERLTWAKEAASNPPVKMEEIMPLIIAVNRSSTPAQITGASDTAIQNNVDAVIDFFAV